MPASCVVGGCFNKGGKGITLHRFPKYDKIRKIWIRFVNNTRSDFVWSERSVLCSDKDHVCGKDGTCRNNRPIWSRLIRG